jgi:hypothetical protein
MRGRRFFKVKNELFIVESSAIRERPLRKLPKLPPHPVQLCLSIFKPQAQTFVDIFVEVFKELVASIL